MYNHPMAMSLETQEIIFAFAADNKDNYESWGKYELDELQDAYAEMPEEERSSSTGKRIKDRIKELESGKDQVQELRQEEEEKEEISEEQSEDNEQEETPEHRSEESKQKTPIIIGGIIIGVVVLLLVIYFF